MSRMRTNRNRRTTFVWTDTEEAQMRAIFDEHPGISARQAAIKFSRQNPNYPQNWRVYQKSLDVMHSIREQQQETEEPIQLVPTITATTILGESGEPVDKFDFVVTTTTLGTIAAPTLEAAKQMVLDSIGKLGWNTLHITVNPVRKQIEAELDEDKTD